ncbi:hypothetical protein FJTKL_10968 [Diaporthe vaccinii]|uniref:WSC domain-containing protein n=1 Tax=Diaporthe vaccinii TaxID=105482 RepID=A0ABR4EIY3_9PEZI
MCHPVSAVIIALLWAASVTAQSPDVDHHTADSQEWTIVESHCWSSVPPRRHKPYLACWLLKANSDTKHDTRALDHHAVNWDTSCATIEKCLTACEIEGYCLAGLEYGHECWCGNVVQGEVRPVPDSYCNFPCSGDYDENCGGYGFMGLYIRRGFEFIIEPPRYSLRYPDKHDYGLPGGLN